MLQDNGFIKDKRLFLLDIDGTVCIGQRLIDGTREFLKAVKNSGGQFVFITNNSTRRYRRLYPVIPETGSNDRLYQFCHCLFLPRSSI